MAARSTNPVDAYAQRVVAGTVPAGKYHRLACVRHLSDRAREGTKDFPFVFKWEDRDTRGALRGCALRFIEFARRMKHYKGRQFAGKPFEPTENQVFRLGSVFGWRHRDTGYRRFTTAYNELPRKTGKSFEAAVVGLYVTFFEGEPGAEGYCIATKEKQAKIVFDVMKKIVKSSGLSSRIKINAANLNRESTESKLEPLGSDSDTTDGLNPQFTGVDELHAFKVRGLLDVMESATGARVNPLMYQITTAGKDPLSPCGVQHDYACRILDGVLGDDDSTLSFFAFIAHADSTDDPWDERTWIKANPHYGISVSPEDLRKLAAKARQIPSAAQEFKQKRLNLWGDEYASCLSVEGWSQGQSKWTEDDMVGERCYAGIDLAKKLDLMVLSLVFPPVDDRASWRIIQRIWTPKNTIEARSHRDRVPYEVWADQGWLIPVDGSRMSSDLVRQELLRLRDRFEIARIGFDPWHSDTPMNDLTSKDGIPEEDVVEIPQTYSGMSAACLEMQSAILCGDVDARGCPVTAWAVANTVANQDGKENLMFAKGKSRGRIDPVIAATIGMALALRSEGDDAESVYERGESLGL